MASLKRRKGEEGKCIHEHKITSNDGFSAKVRGVGDSEKEARADALDKVEYLINLLQQIVDEEG
jgi:hypothetical protein